MIQYNPKDWFTFIFRFHKADTIRKLLPMILGMTLYTTLVVFLEIYFDLNSDSNVRNIPQMHSLLGFAISMLLVFRTNTAYDRWWEGRKLWGSLVNASRNLAIKITVILAPDEIKLRKQLGRAIGGFALALHHHLRKEKIRIELFEHEDEEDTFSPIDHEKHVPIQMAGFIVKILDQQYKAKKITGEQYINLNTEVNAFMDICGACERIKNTPIPFSYSVFIKKFIFFYVMSLPFGFGYSLGYYTVPVVVFIFYVLASLELIAEEIEDPFSGDENDLPTLRLSESIQNNVLEILKIN
ncbi:MAG: bestrophin family ion channel [Saprospiraceae bacterium]|nr:bestrophin family ion channel [Saprospiraceae bacterium]